VTRSNTSPRPFAADQLRTALGDVGGPARPDYLLDIVAQAGRTRQRPAWTFLAGWVSMDVAVRREGVRRPAIVFASVLLLVVLLAAGIVYVGSRLGQPTSPETRASPAPGYSRFTSPLQGIAIDYPSGWQVRPATEPWAYDAVGFDAPDIDVIYDPEFQDDVYIGLASGPIGMQSNPPDSSFGLEAATRMCDAANWGGGDWGGGAGSQGIVLGRLSLPTEDIRGWAGYCHVHPDGPMNHYTFVATPTRGYVIFLHLGQESLTPSFDGRGFEALLETVELLP
jgi:hypothetical protein